MDTNVLLRMADAGREMHAEALGAVEWLDANRHECVLVPQVIYEYWVVATRPTENNGLGMTTTQTNMAISQWLTVFRLLLDERGIFDCWRELVVSNDVKGKNAHDTRLVAAMRRHGLKNILTFNKPDFIRFSDMVVIAPIEIIPGQSPSPSLA